VRAARSAPASSRSSASAASAMEALVEHPAPKNADTESGSEVTRPVQPGHQETGRIRAPAVSQVPAICIPRMSTTLILRE